MTRLDVVSMYSPVAGSTRVRLTDWVRHLHLDAATHEFAGLPNAGVGTLVSHPRAVARALVELERFDVSASNLLLSREASPFSRGRQEERMLRQAQHSAYDIDDALFHDTSTRRRAFGGPSKFERAARTADVVIAGSEYLAQWASRFNTDVRIIPSCVEPADYVMADHAARDGVAPTMVWLGSASTEQYLVPLVDELRRVHERTGARLTLISAPAENPALAAIADMTDRVAWTPGGFAAELARADVGLAPLDDTAFARGKCAYKILQYGAAGLPVVGSPVGANELALQRIGGTAIRSGESWTDAVISALSASAGERSRVGHHARAMVEQYYSFQAWAPEWRRAVLAS